MRTLILSLLIALPCLARGQDAPVDVAPVLSATFAKAQESGALKRILGERFYKDKRGGLVTVKASLDAKTTRLNLSVEFRAIGAMRQETLALTSAYSLERGVLLESGLELVRGRDRMTARGPLVRGEEPVLQLAVSEARGEHESKRIAEVPFAVDGIPFGLAVFVLPLLTDQGLPETLPFRAYHPVSMALNAEGSVLRHTDGETVIEGFVPGQTEPTVIRVEEGKIAQVRLGEHDTLTPLSAAEAKQLRGE